MPWDVDQSKTGVFNQSNVAITGGTIGGNKLLRINNGTRQLKIIPFGDSITQGSAVLASGYWQFGNAYAETSIYQAGPRYQIIRNAGIGGNTTTQMLARIATDVLAYSPDIVLLCGGRNDIVASMSNARILTCMGNLESMVRQMLQAGILPVIVTPPASSSTPIETRKLIPFYYLLAQAYGLPLIDFFRVTVNPATGNYLSGYSGDGTHPNPTAVTAIAPFVAATLQNISASFCPPYMSSFSDPNTGNFANLLANAAFANSTSPPTPNGWSVNSTNATQTLVAATPSVSAPYNGNTFTYNKTLAGAAYALSGAGIGVGAAYAVGDTLQFSGRINVTGNAPATASGFSLALEGLPGGIVRPFTSCPYNGDFVFCHQFVVQAGNTSFTPTLFVNDVALYKVNNLTVFNLTSAAAIYTPNPN